MEQRQEINKGTKVYELWDGQVKPYYKENNLQEYEEEAWGTKCVFNITEPILTVYQAQGENTGKAVVIIPGGGYGLVAMYHEGYDLAEVLAGQGITAAVLKYRLPDPQTSDRPELVPLTDAWRALAIMRENAEKYGIHPNKVGMVGFSAGSHLATVTSLWESEHPGSKPDFTALIYGVTNLSDANLNWIENELYYRALTEQEIAQNRLLDLVSEESPPAFLVHAFDDDVCKVEESTLYAQKLFERNVPVEMHLFSQGGHGFGIGQEEDGTDQWVQLFINWLKTRI
ncbi:alpha/beta hydrolase [Chloroflexota bacterium]